MTTSPRPGPHLGEDDCLGLLSGALPLQERKHWIEHLRACAPCESLLRERDAEWERALTVSALALRKLDQDPTRNGQAGRSPARVLEWLWPRRPALRWVMALGLILVIGTGIVLRVQDGKRRALVGELAWLPPLQDGIVLRSGESTGTLSSLRIGLDAYARKDLPAAIAGFSDAKVRPESEPLREAYLGSALAWAGRYEEAADHLKRLDTTLMPDPWSAEVRWTLMIAFRESGQHARADSLLRMLAEEPGEFGVRAKALLLHTR